MRRIEPVTAAVLVAGGLAAILLVIADFTAIYTTRILTVPCTDSANADLANNCSPTGGDRHTHALLVLAAFLLVMSWGAGMGRSRPAAIALIAGGTIVLAITLIGDLPDVHSSGLLKTTYDETTTGPATGFWLELIGGVLAAAAGGIRLARPEGARRAEQAASG
jgi:hypothetical protein